MDKYDNQNPFWLGLMIGNSRLHWAKFEDLKLLETWNTEYSYFENYQDNFLDIVPIRLASVVPKQTKLWQQYPNVEVITLEQIPLKNLYSTLGIDRALAVLGAGTQLGFPVLVIDAGTALTFTGCDRDQSLVGGAILPGLGLQFSALANKTAALPQMSKPQHLPQRWAIETQEAIHSGTVYTLLAGIRDFIEAWCQDFPESQIVLTGGDAHILITYLQEHFPSVYTQILEIPDVIFWGILVLRQKQSQNPKKNNQPDSNG
ncbi:pantothenate kinase [Lyngbya sp. PCC 8106]|uniref:pantothenate kinase n=1 Tax=Lyngbya sp. (strain PCC 8106) TaxID=313612 RepID=UPI0000EA95C2|nr:pantothenate kinase [Lyngbya sp. PCC 8106]EAW35043.1 Putative transcriptional acitvator, Baf [Lyngbya sp. PCC 8106]